MNKTIKRILIALGCVIGVLVLAWAGMMLKMKSEFSSFTPLKTQELVDGISVVQDDIANMFFIKDGAQYVVIDCGMDKDVVVEEMKKLQINPSDVKVVLLTHTDTDHIGALSLFENAKLYISKEEEKILTGEKSRFLFFGNSLPRTDYTMIEDHEVIQIGNLKVEGILAPGHTTGMMAYLINDKYLFTGDILSLKDGKMAPIPSIFNMDTKQAIQSMDIVRHIPTAEYIFTAHWGYTDNYKKAVE